MGVELTLYTIGYESLEPKQFVSALAAHGIDAVIDVRERASSRNAGFNKSALAAALAAQGIAYYHVRSLGCPSAIRYRYREDGDQQAYQSALGAHLDTQTPALQQVADLLATHRCALLCLEADPAQCHRSLVAARIVGIVAGPVRVEHLRPAT